MPTIRAAQTRMMIPANILVHVQTNAETSVKQVIEDDQGTGQS